MRSDLRLGLFLIAERAALLSGRDDEFVAVILKGYTGMRWGEIVGLETEFARPGAIRVEHQLDELDSGELIGCPPKDDSYGTIDAPGWLSALVADHIARTKPMPCPCHGKRYVFRGQGTARTGGHTGAKLVDVAHRAGVSTGTVSNVLNHPERVREDTHAPRRTRHRRVELRPRRHPDAEPRPEEELRVEPTLVSARLRGRLATRRRRAVGPRVSSGALQGRTRRWRLGWRRGGLAARSLGGRCSGDRGRAPRSWRRRPRRPQRRVRLRR